MTCHCSIDKFLFQVINFLLVCVNLNSVCLLISHTSWLCVTAGQKIFNRLNRQPSKLTGALSTGVKFYKDAPVTDN
jgi:hypothetical protein